MPKSY